MKNRIIKIFFCFFFFILQEHYQSDNNNGIVNEQQSQQQQQQQQTDDKYQRKHLDSIDSAIDDPSINSTSTSGDRKSVV